MLGDALDAEEAYRIGLVNKVVADDSLGRGTEPGRATCHDADERPGQDEARPLRQLREGLETALEAEAEGQTFCGYTQDHKEGVTAFFEKREARFTGR